MAFLSLAIRCIGTVKHSSAFLEVCAPLSRCVHLSRALAERNTDQSKGKVSKKIEDFRAKRKEDKLLKRKLAQKRKKDAEERRQKLSESVMSQESTKKPTAEKSHLTGGEPY